MNRLYVYIYVLLYVYMYGVCTVYNNQSLENEI